MSIRPGGSVRRGRSFVCESHRGIDPVTKPAPERIRRAPERILEGLALRSCKGLGHVIGEVEVLRVSLSPDSDAEAREVGGAEPPDDRAHAVVPRSRASSPQPKRPERKLDLVVHDTELREVDSITLTKSR